MRRGRGSLVVKVWDRGWFVSSLSPLKTRRGPLNSAGLSIGYLERVPRNPDKLSLARFSGYEFQSTSAKGASIASTPRARNELKSALPLKKFLIQSSLRTSYASEYKAGLID
ncbi:hypothetical protein TNCV_4649861 [Trichonephila clavipes]|uniref:Uncharacterized protein n=1 Tax=Trichonephila clavipes TaxID=2585209 RepID=A0A8X6SX69_TRICX|nr:hypothetical protein TNCV_4649861 [Trichonephila clavipes]